MTIAVNIIKMKGGFSWTP